MTQPRQCVTQATCLNCDDEDENNINEFSVTNTDHDTDDEEGTTIRHDVKCTCGETGTVVVDENGTRASDGISYKDASWNQESESDE